jgi:hypothetical protein
MSAILVWKKPGTSALEMKTATTMRSSIISTQLCSSKCRYLPTTPVADEMQFHKNAAVERYLRETQASLDAYCVQIVLPSSRMRNFDRANFISETTMVQGHDRRAHDTTAAEQHTVLTSRARNLSCADYTTWDGEDAYVHELLQAIGRCLNQPTFQTSMLYAVNLSILLSSSLLLQVSSIKQVFTITSETALRRHHVATWSISFSCMRSSHAS